jgi:hypothetical protein
VPITPATSTPVCRPIGLGEGAPNIPIGGASNLHYDIGRHDAALDGDQEPFLPVFQQIADRGDIIGGEIDLRGDFGVRVSCCMCWSRLPLR